jgi:hypothetical protein
MTSLAVGISIALLLTASFAFRFRNARRPKLLVVYFLVFLALEWLGARYFLPPDALGIEVAYVCLALAAIFAGAIYLAERYEATNENSD